MAKSRIFISYSRQDEAFARQLATRLTQVGADVWLDVEDIPAGTKWSSAVQQGLDAAQVMVVVISPESMDSSNVEDEWQYFLDQRKPVIPVLHRQPERIHFQLNRLQWVDFVQQPFEVAFARLHEQISAKGVSLAPMSGGSDTATGRIISTQEMPTLQAQPQARLGEQLPPAASTNPSFKTAPLTPAQPGNRNMMLLVGLLVAAVLVIMGLVFALGLLIGSGDVRTDSATENARLLLGAMATRDREDVADLSCEDYDATQETELWGVPIDADSVTCSATGDNVVACAFATEEGRTGLVTFEIGGEAQICGVQTFAWDR